MSCHDEFQASSSSQILHRKSPLRRSDSESSLPAGVEGRFSFEHINAAFAERITLATCISRKLRRKGEAHEP